MKSLSISIRSITTPELVIQTTRQLKSFALNVIYFYHTFLIKQLYFKLVFSRIGNLYITGISLFLCFVIKRLVVLISATADLSMEKKIVEDEKLSIQQALLVLSEMRTTSQAEEVDTNEKNEEVVHVVENLIEEKGGSVRSRSRSRTAESKKDE